MVPTLASSTSCVQQQLPIMVLHGAMFFRPNAASSSPPLFQIKRQLPQADGTGAVVAMNFLAGIAGGTVATTLNTPFDVVTSRMVRNSSLECIRPVFVELVERAAGGENYDVGQRNVLPGDPIKYRHAIPSLVLIAREEGGRALFKGYVPKLVRLGPGGGILFVVFDFISNLLRERD